MKTRIISATVVILFTIALIVSQIYCPVIFTAAAALISAVCVFELLYETKITDNKLITAVSAVFSVLIPFIICGYLKFPLWAAFAVYITVVFAISLKYYSSFSITALLAAIIFPLIIPAALSCFVMITQYGKGGLFSMLLVFCYSAFADTGAYFTGVLIGKHKMSPVISPKKTWEGFVGGIVWGVLSSLILCLIYDFALHYEVNYLLVLLTAPIFVVIGVLGDLSASMIKRHCEIKDFGKVIPGHGGIMDRLDSILMIVPIFYLFITNVNIIK